MIWYIIVSIMLVYVLLNHLRLQSGLGKKRESKPLEHYPSVSVIRPIKGKDVGMHENIKAAFEHDYPGVVETLFVLDGPEEPAYPIIQELIKEFKTDEEQVQIIYSGKPPSNRTGKLNAMIEAYAQSKGELIVFADSDIRTAPHHLKTVVETLMSRKKGGAAFAPVIVDQPQKTAGDTGYALMLNSFYSPNAAKVAAKKNYILDFVMGQFMIFKREAIEAIGGLISAEGQLVDDMFLGKQVHDAGYENIMAPCYVPIIQQNLPWKEFIDIYIKWITFSKSGLSAWSFKLAPWIMGVIFWIGLVGAMILPFLGATIPAILSLMVPILLSESLNHLNSIIGAAPVPLKLRWVPFFIILISPVIYGRISLKREVIWRGRVYKLNKRSTLS